MIKKLSQGIVKKMNSIYPRSEEDNQKMEYFFEVVIDQLFILCIVILLCALIGYHREAIISFIGCMVFRTFAGGLHFKKRLPCIIVTSSFAMVGGLIIYLFNIPTAVCMVLLLIDLVVAAAFAPQTTKNKPITEKFRKIRKVESVVVICIYIAVLMFGPHKWGSGLAVGASMGAVTIFPVFMKMTE